MKIVITDQDQGSSAESGGKLAKKNQHMGLEKYEQKMTLSCV